MSWYSIGRSLAKEPLRQQTPSPSVPQWSGNLCRQVSSSVAPYRSFPPVTPTEHGDCVRSPVQAQETHAKQYRDRRLDRPGASRVHLRQWRETREFLGSHHQRSRAAPGPQDPLAAGKGVPIATEKKTTNLARGPSSTAVFLLETRLRAVDSRSHIPERLSRIKKLRNHVV